MTIPPIQRKPKSRAATDFRECRDARGRRISYIVSDEPTVIGIGVHSIYDPLSNLSSFRRVGGDDAAMTDADEPFPGRGLVVLGVSKFDRPSLAQVERMTDIDGASVAAAIRDDITKRHRGQPQRTAIGSADARMTTRDQYNRDRLIAIGTALHGERWQSATARDLDVDKRQVHRWVSGEYAVPDGVVADLITIAKSRRGDIDAALAKARGETST